MNDHNFALRHNITPYIGFPIILSPILFLSSYVGITKNDWGGFWAFLLIFCAFFPAYVLFSLRYRVWIADDALHMQAATWNFKPNVRSIKIANISSIQQEVSNARTAASLRRPFRRIAIYAPSKDGTDFIDISLKHFVHADIKKLLEIIRSERPDLSVPPIH